LQSGYSRTNAKVKKPEMNPAINNLKKIMI
jgi:hypothetical protein